MAGLPSVSTKPHTPTLGYAVVAIVAVVLVYHFTIGRRRRRG